MAATIIITGCNKTETPDDVANAVIPEGCTSRFDGCNNCFVEDGKVAGCTKMYCETPSEPKCMQFANTDEKQDTEATTPTIPENCTSWFDGCNNCSVKDGKADACTLMYCETPTEPKCNEFK